MNPGLPLDHEDVSNALAVSSQAMNLFLGDFCPHERDKLVNEYNGHSSYLKDQIKVYGVVDDQALTTDDINENDTDEEETDEEGPADEDSDEEDSNNEEVPSTSSGFYVNERDLTENRIKILLKSMQRRENETRNKHNNPTKYWRFHQGRNGGRIIMNDFSSTTLTNFFKEHGTNTANEIVPLQIKIAPMCEGFKLFFSDPCVWGQALSSRFIAKL